MSKISSKQRYVQLMEWLETVKTSQKPKKANSRNQSRMSYYKNKGVQ